MELSYGEITDFVPGVDVLIDKGAVNVLLKVRDRRKGETVWTLVEVMTGVEFRTQGEEKLEVLRDVLSEPPFPTDVI